MKNSPTAPPPKFDILDLVAYLWLSAPLLLFIAGWIVLPLALPLIAAFVLVSWRSIRPSFSGKVAVFEPYLRSWKDSVAIGCMFAVILFFAGLTGNWQQHSDFLVRNDIFYNLVSEGWPPHLDDHRYFIYYFQAWLPAALVGKITGWVVAQWVYYIWCLLGIYLVLHYIFKYLGRITFVVGAFFLIWNGLEFIPGVLLRYGLEGGSLAPFIYVNNHILEPFDPFGTSFSIKSIIHHWLPIALICGLCLQREVLKKWGTFLGVLALMYSPIAAIFFLPVLVFLYCDLFFFVEKGDENDKRGGANEMLRSACSPLSLVSYLIAALVIVPYYLSADQASPLKLDNLNMKMLFRLAYFMFFHAGICAILIRKFCKKRLLWVALLSLLLCMVASATVNTEMSMKGSAISSYYLFILFSYSWQRAKHSDRVWFILYAIGISSYFITMHGAAAALAVGGILFFLLYHKRCAVVLLALFGCICFYLFPRKIQGIKDKLTGEKNIYSQRVGIYQADGGSGKWWWYKTFPMKDELPFWFRR